MVYSVTAGTPTSGFAPSRPTATATCSRSWTRRSPLASVNVRRGATHAAGLSLGCPPRIVRHGLMGRVSRNTTQRPFRHHPYGEQVGRGRGSSCHGWSSVAYWRLREFRVPCGCMSVSFGVACLVRVHCPWANTRHRRYAPGTRTPPLTCKNNGCSRDSQEGPASGMALRALCGSISPGARR